MAYQDSRVACLGLLREHADQGRLADARLAADQDEPPSAPKYLVEAIAQCGSFTDSSDEHRCAHGKVL